MKETMIDIKDIKYSAARDINWGADFDDFEDKQKIIYLKKFSASMNQAADIIQTERNQLVSELESMKMSLTNVQEALDIQKNIVTKTITDNNLSMQTHALEINELKKQLREALADGDNNQLVY